MTAGSAGPDTQVAAVGAALAVEAHGWGWRHAARRAWAVRGLDVTIAPGERVLLLGPSGSGKSTLLAGLAGLLDPGTGDEVGELRVGGLPARRARTESVGGGRTGTGLLLQDPQAQTVLARCGDDVAFGLENHAVPRERIWPRVADALRGVGFGYPQRHPTAALSGGERQRLALAGVLALRPGLLLLDEPTAMLDPAGADLLRELVAAVVSARAATCVLVEHRIEPWLPLIDRVLVLEPGAGLAADGTADAVLREPGTAARLAAAGIWLPGRLAPAAGDPPVAGELLLRARGLAADRPRRADPLGELPPAAPGPVVSGVDLELRAGRALLVTGPNGAGKSTLALVLAGLAAPAGGELVPAPALAAGLAGPPNQWTAEQLVTRIGTVFQDPQHQFVAATVEQELGVGPRRAGLPEAEIAARTRELLGRLRLAHVARASPFTLSGGEQRRLSVATALATRPRILVLDEPTFGQDARTWAELVALLRELLAEGTAVVTVTHDAELVAALSAGGAGDVLRLPARPAVPPPSAGSSVATRRRVVGFPPALARANAVAKLAVALAVPLVLVLSVDVVTAGTAVLLELLALPWTGVRPTGLLRRGWVVLAGAVPASVLTAVLADRGGELLVGAGPLAVTTGSLTAAAAIGLRILAIGLPGVVLIATTDPTDLADGLAQVVRLPHRFVLSALAALRLLGLLAGEWQLLVLARRARGIGGGARHRVRALPGLVFALLVLAVRRATVLATAMEARGFGVRGSRTWARPSRFTARDAAIAIGGGLLLPGIAVATGVAAGTWHLVLR